MSFETRISSRERSETSRDGLLLNPCWSEPAGVADLASPNVVNEETRSPMKNRPIPNVIRVGRVKGRDLYLLLGVGTGIHLSLLMVKGVRGMNVNTSMACYKNSGM